jgi:hypothetical protein
MVSIAYIKFLIIAIKEYQKYLFKNKLKNYQKHVKHNNIVKKNIYMKKTNTNRSHQIFD